MAMDIQKVNEITESISISKVIGMDSAGNMVTAPSENVMAKEMYRSVSGKGSVWINKIASIAEISTTKGTVVYVYLGKGILLGDTQHYTTDEREAINNNKIWVNYDYGNSCINVIDHTGEDLNIAVGVIGFTDYAITNL